MPRWASRIQLRVTAVRSERLGSISEADAIAEGVTPDVRKMAHPDFMPNERAFIELWESIHGDCEFNQIMQVIEFERVK